MAKRLLIAEWQRGLELYRVYDPYTPWHTISYASDHEAVERIAAEERDHPTVTYDESGRTNDNGKG